MTFQNLMEPQTPLARHVQKEVMPCREAKSIMKQPVGNKFLGQAKWGENLHVALTYVKPRLTTAAVVV